MKKSLHPILCLLLLLTLVLPPTVWGATKDPTVSYRDGKTAKDPVSDRLRKLFGEKENLTYLIKLKTQADTQKAAAGAAKKAEKNKQTPMQTELAKRSAVVSTLRYTADETQANLKQFLAEQKKAGHVKNYESFYIVNAIAVTGDQQTVDKLAAFPEVEKILPNERRQLIGLEKEKSTGKPTANTQSIEWNIEQIGAPAVWAMGIDGAGTVVANIDSGVQWNHPGLKQQYRGYDGANPDQPDHTYNWFDAVNGRSAPYDDQGHGTHTMGTMVGVEPDGSNRVGVAPGAKWIAVKAFTAAGGTDADLLRAGEWIIAPKDADGNPHPEKAPDVVNNSWGGGPGLDEWYRPMVRNWRAAEIFPEFSAGNTTFSNPGGPGSVANPANYPESFATGATDSNKRLASFSLQGPSPYGELKPEVSAPGVNIRSTVPGSNYEGGWNGTSMAGPHVSATVALLKQANASLTVDQIEEILMETAEPLTDGKFPESPNNGYGHGLVNALDAVSSIQSGRGEIRGQVLREGEDTEAPTYQHEAPAETYTGMELPLSIEARDNVSVTEVKLQYRSEESDEWSTLDAKRTAGDYRSGTYQAQVPGDHVLEPALHYRFRIRDFSGNETVTDTYRIQVKPGISVGYFQDFESTPIGWISYGEKNSWEWGIPTSGPGCAASGERVYATNLSGNYDNDANMNLMMPPIDLPDGQAYLQFKQWYETERNYDFAHVFISTDRQNWTQLARYNNLSNGWEDAEIDLSAYAGQRVYILFNLKSDYSVVKPGWYLDDVALSDTPSLTSTPVETRLDQARLKGDTHSKKKAVHPDNIKPAQLKNPQAPTVTTPPAKSENLPMALPLGAKVTVLETGRTVATHPQDGSYSLSHPAGEYTLRAESYGYRSADRRVDVPRDSAQEANFVLEAIPRGTLKGMVTDSKTGEPIQGAKLYLVEDAAVQPVETDGDGRYEISAYEGNYTLHISAPSYYNQNVNVTVQGDRTVEKDVKLKPFIGYPGEIGYDDGTAENAQAFYDAGNGWAVRMSLPEGKGNALVTAGLFRFWDTEWPIPGGTSFQVAVYDASGPDGAPGKKLGGPYDATALRNGEWTTVDLADKGIIVDGDFYMVYIQATPYPNSPGMATDENGPNAGRSWQWVDGAWSPAPKDEGNYMIRARVNYEVTEPVITSPQDGHFTNQSTVTVEGKAAPTTEVKIQNKGKEVAATPARDDGSFSAEVSLKDGENILTATASTPKGTTDPSEPVQIILDREKPKLSIGEPADGLKTNREAVTVKGEAKDEHLDWVKVNGKKADLADDGTYSLRILLDEGENRIQVTAADKAGNKQTEEITLRAKFSAPVIQNLSPEQTVYLKRGETVKIELDSEPGLKGNFAIRMPLTNLPSNVTQLPLHEEGKGHYVAYWTATSKDKVSGAEIEVILEDDYGNTARKTAKGKLYINTKK